MGPGDEGITVSNTFIATVEAIWMTGATPVFADIAADGFLVDPAEIERRVTSKTKAIIAVHLYGELANMEAIGEIARRHNLKLIEDACQAHGATRGGGVAGFIGDVGCLSFYRRRTSARSARAAWCSRGPTRLRRACVRFGTTARWAVTTT